MRVFLQHTLFSGWIMLNLQELEPDLNLCQVLILELIPAPLFQKKKAQTRRVKDPLASAILPSLFLIQMKVHNLKENSYIC